MELDPAKTKFLSDFFETYLKLNEEEEEELMKEMKHSDYADDILELTNSWEERGMKKGKEEVALELLKEGSSVAFVAKVTRLDAVEVKELKKTLENLWIYAIIVKVDVPALM